MSAYGLFWVLLKAILRGHGTARVMFDTEAKEYQYHMAAVGSAYCQPRWDSGWEISLHEERN